MMKASYWRAELAQRLGLLARDVDRALAREVDVVEVQDLVVEALKRSLGDGDQPHREVEAGQPGRGLHQVSQVLEVGPDVLSLADASHGGYQTDGCVWADHLATPPFKQNRSTGSGGAIFRTVADPARQ